MQHIILHIDGVPYWPVRFEFLLNSEAVSLVGGAVLRSETVDVAGLSGVEEDRAGGLSALVLGVLGNGALVLLLLRYVERARRISVLYEANVARGSVPWGSEEMLAQKWGWLRAAIALNIDEAQHSLAQLSIALLGCAAQRPRMWKPAQAWTRP